MPIIIGEESAPSGAGAVLALAPAGPGLLAVASAPPEAASGVPVPSAVLGWVLVADRAVAGGARVDPVLLADGAAWTLDQFRAAFGAGIAVRVMAAG